jgi:molybdate transport system substrate-binding protein
MKAALARVLVVATLLWPAAAVADDIRVLTAGAYKPVLMALAPDFERRSGHHLLVQNDTAGALTKRIAGGEAFDLVVLTSAGLEGAVRDGRLAGAPTPLARVGVGVAVKAGAPRPDIGSVAAFRQALLDARAVATIDPAAGGTSGVYLAQLFERLGIAAVMRTKTVLVPGGFTGERLLSGEADLALQQTSELLAVPGITVLGPLPAEIQRYTVYAGAVSAASKVPAAARALLDTLAGSAAATVLREKGLEPPGTAP